MSPLDALVAAALGGLVSGWSPVATHAGASGTDYVGAYRYSALGQLNELREATGAVLASYVPRLEDGQPLQTLVDPDAEAVWSQMSYSLLGEELTSTDGAGVRRQKTYDGQRN